MDLQCTDCRQYQSPSRLRAGATTNLRSKSRNCFAYRGCVICTVLLSSRGSSIMYGESFSAMVISGRKSQRDLSIGGFQPNSFMPLVSSTLAGSPRMDPSSCSYPANARICEFHIIGPHFPGARGGNIKTVGKMWPRLKAFCMPLTTDLAISRLHCTPRRSHRVKCSCSEPVMQRREFLQAARTPYSSSFVC